MSEKTPSETPTLRRHRRQFVWQILLPIIVLAGMIIATAVLVVMGEAGSGSLWRDVALVWLLAPSLFLALVLIVVTFAAVFGMSRLLKITPRFTGRAQELTLQAEQVIKRVADGIARPFIWLGQAGAGAGSIFKRRRRTDSTGKEENS